MYEESFLDHIKTITLNFFKRINAKINESNGIYSVAVPSIFNNLFDSSNLKFTFNSDVARNELCELITPGSNILFKIIHYNLKNGVVVYTKPKIFLTNTNLNTSVGIRFYFYVLLDGIKNQSYIKYIDVDYESFKILNNDFDLIESEEFQININPENIDYAYISAIDEIKQVMKNITEKFSRDVIDAKNQDLKYVNDEYQKRLDEIDDDIQNQRIRNNRLEIQLEENLTNAIEKVELIREEQKKVILGIKNKHRSSIDYALFAAQMYPYVNS